MVSSFLFPRSSILSVLASWVVYDPQKPSRLQVTTLHLAAAEAGPLDPAARLERLEELREKGLISAAEYQEKRLEILKEL